jgi:hypothetical protein
MSGLHRRLALLLVLASAGCEGTEVGNPNVEPVQLSLTAHSSSDGVTFAADADDDEDAGSDGPAGTAGVTVERMWVSLGAVRFVLDDACGRDPDTRTTVPGPIVADLASEPTALSAKLPDADYCSVRVSLERAAAGDDVPAELVGYSAVISGVRADGVPFLIRTRSKPDFVLRTRGEPFRLASDASPVFLAFDAGAWLAGVDLAASAPDADGRVLVETPGEPLLRTFETNVRSSLSLFKDADKNGALDRDEVATPLAD